PTPSTFVEDKLSFFEKKSPRIEIGRHPRQNIHGGTVLLIIDALGDALSGLLNFGEQGLVGLPPGSGHLQIHRALDPTTLTQLIHHRGHRTLVLVQERNEPAIQIGDRSLLLTQRTQHLPVATPQRIRRQNPLEIILDQPVQMLEPIADRKLGHGTPRTLQRLDPSSPTMPTHGPEKPLKNLRNTTEDPTPTPPLLGGLGSYPPHRAAQNESTRKGARPWAPPTSARSNTKTSRSTGYVFTWPNRGKAHWWCFCTASPRVGTPGAT